MRVPKKVTDLTLCGRLIARKPDNVVGKTKQIYSAAEKALRYARFHRGGFIVFCGFLYRVLTRGEKVCFYSVFLSETRKNT